MRALFFLKHPGNVRMFESTIGGLAARGHDVHLAFDQVKTAESLVLVQRLAKSEPRITYGAGPGTPAGLADVRTALRASIDYLRYLDPAYADAHKLRERAADAAPAALRRALASPPSRVVPPRVLRRALQYVERRLPTPANVEAYLRGFKPDLVLVSPLVGVASRQADALRAAARAGIPTVFPVHSWDNLTNKGLLRDVPDVTIVWNDAQAREAVELQAVPADRVVVAGAAGFDHWFDRSPSRARSELLGEAGIAGADRPFLLYACSSPFIAPDETAFVRDWLAQVRAFAPLRDIAVIVRPHPQNALQWLSVELDDPYAAIWPRGGQDPLDESSRRLYYDSLRLSSAVVGLNTSALVEAAIVGRPVHTLLASGYATTQTGTLHFRHLTAGHLHAAATWDDHLAGLAAAAVTDTPDPASAAFAQAFLRPSGMPATPRVLDAIEGAVERPRVRPAPSRRLIERALAPADARLRARRRASEPAAPKPHPAIRDARRALRELAREPGEILVGPFRSEVGHELLYWIPFLRWALDVEPALAGRLVVASRGGVGTWYEGIASEYVELYDLVPPAELWQRAQSAAAEVRGKRKQTVFGSVDRELVELAAAARGRTAGAVLHPSLLFDLMRSASRDPIPRGQEPYRHELLQATVNALDLPDSYTAVRFYASAAFPGTEANRELAAAVIEQLIEYGDVVLLSPGAAHDDHAELSIADERLTIVETDAAGNLAVQTAVIAGARLFAGTYGGLSYLAPLLGVDAATFYSERNFRIEHLEVAQRLSAQDARFGRLHAFEPGQLEHLRPLLRATDASRQ